MLGWTVRRSVIYLGPCQLQSIPISPPRTVAEDQYHEIISASDAWLIADEENEGRGSERELLTTNSARRIKGLVEQVTGEFRLTLLTPKMM